MVEMQPVDFVELYVPICHLLPRWDNEREYCEKFLVVIDPSLVNRGLISQLIEI
jgi:hypothetical protein